jgi:non-ribosomal peptide synthetase component E (peptide arylation enzyme)
VFEISTENPDLLLHVDRAKDLIIRGGYKISAAEVESVLTSDTRIVEAAAVAMPDELLGERVCVCVVMKSSSDSIELSDVQQIFQQAGVAKFKWPERIEFMTELPRNPIGKVLKRQLRETIREQEGAR